MRQANGCLSLVVASGVLDALRQHSGYSGLGLRQLCKFWVTSADFAVGFFLPSVMSAAL
jgi:hypothetical protein